MNLVLIVIVLLLLFGGLGGGYYGYRGGNVRRRVQPDRLARNRGDPHAAVRWRPLLLMFARVAHDFSAPLAAFYRTA
jgi:hypothetical protein